MLEHVALEESNFCGFPEFSSGNSAQVENVQLCSMCNFRWRASIQDLMRIKPLILNAGFGNYLARPLFRERHRPNMSETEAEELLKEGLKVRNPLSLFYPHVWKQT